MVHEFGHHFAGLGDEYYSSDVAYEDFSGGQVEPWEPNITARTERAKIKWAALIPADVPIPTPDEERFDDAVGVFEGAGYKARGLYRPTRDSKMFHKGLLPYGPVNEAAIERMIRYHIGEEVDR